MARAAIVGGTTASLTGGKFANGAIVGSFSFMFNDLIHEKTGLLTVHSRLVVADENGNEKYGFSFGAENRWEGLFSSASGTSSPSASGWGAGIVYPDYGDDATRTVEVFKTTPAEDDAMIKYMQSREEDRRRYNLITDSCITFCSNQMEYMKNEISKAREEHRQPSFAH